MSNLTEYQRENLMLLVGTNTVPNYVAARMLASDGKTLVHLVSSNEMVGGGMQEALIKVLERTGHRLAEPVIVDPVNPDDICAKVRGRVLATSGSWGLHYTGGKKIMATHAYRAMETALATRVPPEEGVYSYLDADSLTLVIDPLEGRPVGPIAAHQNPEAEIRLTLADLLELQGESERTLKKVRWSEYPAGELDRRTLSGPKRPHRVPFRPEVRRSLLTAWMGDGREAMKAWRDKGLKAAGGPSLVPACVPEIGGEDLATLAAKWGETVKHLQGWFHGNWLEDYVLDLVRGIADTCKLTDYALGLEPDLWRPQAPNEHFECDVLVTQGYRLFYISVTTDDSNALCKSKLFEAYLRAQRLGGDEADAALVTFHPNSARLQREIREAHGSKAKVRVFGPEHLFDRDRQELRLAESLVDWFASPKRRSND